MLQEAACFHHPLHVAKTAEIGRCPVCAAFGEDFGLKSSKSSRLIRRFFDVGIGLLGCLCIVLFTPFIALANWLASPGPLFYTQERIGRAGQPFTIYKFRTMRPGSETAWTSLNDERITPVGHFLRRVHFDEIPQFWNILRGDMAFIGPRPERAFFVEQFAQHSPGYLARYLIKPGLTGWAQVKAGYGDSFEDIGHKLYYDLYYIQNQGLWLDVVIILKTVAVVAGGKGR